MFNFDEIFCAEDITEYLKENPDTEDRELLDGILDQVMDGGFRDSGAPIIPDEMFVEYAQQFAESIEAISNLGWPYYHIDWEAAAESLQIDYTNIWISERSWWVR